ncbi:hypothetical protein Erwinia_phage_Fougasse_00004 [Erwinia phage Fougasse]|uniref:Gp86 n=1 Tax=Erwinia phage vB_EamM-Y2 TaxID=1051676 RepID=G0YQ35_9CAUD|nr:gp86 [Erwinia phage vB_EamM-Y2]WJN63774.1 hypothetical protein Erwinia_phage_Berlingot_00049 [Erwinia phage Berlingot]WJN63877.1 hypothetical protein Erwinia_phage_Calisson_00074 [Erwinia phage Calisson]WJN63936.1 hypothetical protein Erwinia_phage_Farigoule_00049 [Erwinia phage Farigoule]WJN63967.1 hypothetical protein Erwinia_phage_Fougasse_00004 [Erwinia phage Fougasse]WJN64092.1 hypothetical protein Erwinia_phage_Mauresque_00050 [Erwinia phage Mauresque]WJN64170.1 hypothetical protein 
MAKGWSFGALTEALKGAAFLDIGTVANSVAAGNDSRIVGAAQKSRNLGDLLDYAAARNQLSAAFVNGDGNVDFYCRNNGGPTAAVNNQRLDFRLLSKADTEGNEFTPFKVGGATQGAQAVRLDQFQSGSNGNGAWTKIPNGPMWCRQNLSLAANATTTWNFPAQFPGSPAVFFSSFNGENRAWFNGISANGCNIYNPQNVAVNVNVYAIW